MSVFVYRRSISWVSQSNKQMAQMNQIGPLYGCYLGLICVMYKIYQNIYSQRNIFEQKCFSSDLMFCYLVKIIGGLVKEHTIFNFRT